tara:strand:- start:2797 stop:5154 length:2358 start_codon:yes stop_codon:yes gene_type:complete
MNKLGKSIARPVMAIISMPVFFFLGTISEVAQAERVLEEVVVTARKREESLQDAPVIMSAFSKQQLDAYNLDRMEDIAGMTPGLNIGEAQSPTGGTISMRGVQTGTASPAFDQAVAIVVDGIAVNHAGILRVSQVDNAQVEILKGPQALFFGKNSPGGVISFRTSDPGEGTEWSFKTGYESEARETYAEGVISGRFSDALAARLAVYYSDMDGWLYNDPDPAFFGTLSGGADSSRIPATKETFYRGTLLFDPSDAVSMRSKLSYNNTEGTAYFALSQLVKCPLGAAQGAPTDDCKANDKIDRSVVLPEIANWNPLMQGDPSNRGEIEWLMASHEMTFQLSDSLELVSLTGYVDGDDQQRTAFQIGSLGFFGGSMEIYQEKVTQEFRLTSNFGGTANFMLGAFYADEEVESEFNVGISGVTQGFPGLLVPLSAPDPRYAQDTKSYSLFGQVIWDISDTVELSAGLRWTKEEKGFSASEAGLAVTNIVDSEDFTNTSPELTLAWRPTDNSTYFVSYKEGFKSGGFNTAFVSGGFAAQAPNIIDTSFGQETVDGFEGGAKWILKDGTLRLNASAYYYEYEGMQLSSFDGTTISILVQNAGKSTVHGFEMDLNYLTSIEGLSLRFGGAFNSAEFDEFLAPCYVAQTAAQGCNIGGGLAQDLAGETLSNAPDTSMVAGFSFAREISQNLSLSTSWDLEYSSDYYTQTTLGPNSIQDSYTRLNANFTLAHQSGWELNFVGRNLTEEYVMTTGTDSLFTGNSALGIPADFYSSVSRGREFYLQLKIDSSIFK